MRTEVWRRRISKLSPFSSRPGPESTSWRTKERSLPRVFNRNFKSLVSHPNHVFEITHRNSIVVESKSSSVNPESMLDILKASAAESEEKSDEITEKFLSQSIQIDEFLDQFKSTRMEMHLRKLKVDKMQELLRQGVGNGQHPPPQGNYQPGNFYNAPYPNAMPGGYPMMPMPPNYRSPYWVLW